MTETPQQAPATAGEFGSFLKSKGIDSEPLGPDKDNVEMFALDPKNLVTACMLLKETGFDFLVLLTTTDVKKGYQSIYTLHSTATKKSLRIKVTVPKDNPMIPTVSHVWSTANWYEREGYDMMGIIYTGHPDLKRILNPEDWEGFPLRKDYIPPSDSLNGPHPLRETKYAEQTLSKSEKGEKLCQ
ncbi:MAG: NADH-quinone oxidoreductase subunit C [Candidatus Melainabacteria bacterium]|nr:NADH-quinone oxidoreductase subunit C [Candidatus Melainabacteria bacterium]MBI3308752.1 NADH-quinone oxidoreductase subunit C [Candidatus Melainabacteria bacterium]